MMILNLVVVENSEVKEVISSVSQSNLLKEMRDMGMVNEEVRMSDIPKLMLDDHDLFKDTKFKGTKLFISELISG